MTAPFHFGDEFLVNTTTDGTQNIPQVAGLADGRFIATWMSIDGSDFAIRAQVFNADGSKAGAELLISDSADQAYIPHATGLAGGGFVLSWTNFNGADTPQYAPRAQFFNADGSKSGDEFTPGSPEGPASIFSQIVELADGRLLAVWQDFRSSGDNSGSNGVYAQYIDAKGDPSGDAFLVNTTTAGDQTEPVIAALGNGGFVVAWTDGSASGGDTDGDAVRAQVFDAAGHKSGSEILVNTETTDQQSGPAVGLLANGDFVVAWEDESHTAPDTSGTAVRAQIFEADGVKVGHEIVVNTTTTFNQNNPVVTALADGGFIVAFQDDSHSGDDTDLQTIRAQRFDGAGGKVGDEFVVVTTTADNQHNPGITTLADGRIFVAWMDDSQSPDDPDGSALRGQLFDLRPDGMNLFGSPLGDDLIGTAFSDVMKGRSGDDHLAGGNGHDEILGQAGNDILHGGLGNDFIEGGRGADSLFGDFGADIFFFAGLKDSTRKAIGRDTIEDFSHGQGDVIDLSEIDAKRGGADNDFKFIGTKGFKGKAGQLQAKDKHGDVIVKGDIDGDGKADFAILVKDVSGLDAHDFIL